MAVQVSLYRQVLQDRQDLYNNALNNGVYSPFIYPWDTLPIIFLLVGVYFTPQLPALAGRLSRLLLFLLSCVYMIARWPYVRTIGFAGGYGLGLAGAWGAIMTCALLVLHDPAKDFRRIEAKMPNGREPSAEQRQPSTANSHARRPDALQRRTSPQVQRTDRLFSKSARSKSTGIDHLVWQEYPTEYFHRLDWSVDLITTFRGINWNFRVPLKTYIVPPPEGDPPEFSMEASRLEKEALSRLRLTSILNFLYYYIVMDLLKTFMVTDPYWLGIAPLHSPTPWTWLKILNDMLPGATRFVRLCVSLTATVNALTLIFSLSPLFFATVLPYVLGERLYTVTKSPLLGTWMYPAQWGSMFSTLCNNGLAGMWSTWWHQIFRYGISEPSRLLMHRLKIAPRSRLGRCLQLLIAFGLTASLHAAASSTTFSIIPSKPSHPFIFFISQAAGILVQTEISGRLNKLTKFPGPVRQAANFGFVLIFMWFVGPYLADDFARCQVWLFEPLPFSVMRGLGFGPGDCWFPWISFASGGGWLGWWNGGDWYRSGIGIY